MKSHLFAAVILSSLPLSAVSLWSEGLPSQGDLSDDYLNPNRFTLSLGANTISASVNSSDGLPGSIAADQDLFTLIVPDGLQISGIFLLSYRFPVPGNLSFIGYQDGPTLQQAPETFTFDTSDRIADLLFGASQVMTDPSFFPFAPPEPNLLDEFGAGTFASAGPLTPGEYAFWIRETEIEPATFTLNFSTTEFTPLPEPSVAVLALLAAPLLGRRMRARNPYP